MRHISFSMTTAQIQDHTKTITRRHGWKFLKPGNRLWAVEKCQGLKKGEKVKRICVIEVVAIRREPLNDLTKNPSYGTIEVIAEGFPTITPEEFVEKLCIAIRIRPDNIITRIEFKYLDKS